MNIRSIIVCAALLLLAFHSNSDAVSITGADWRIHFNLPDQNASIASATPDEYAIRDALVARIDELQTNNRAWLATYTFSGSNKTAGAAGPIIQAMEQALNRGARIAFVADAGIDITTRNGGTNSLQGLSTRAANPLQLVRDDSTSGIMHDKLGVFDYGSTNKWVFITSWNFTGGASSFQWNMALDLRSPTLFAAYSNEFVELLAGRFHDHATKSHTHDNRPFGLPESFGGGIARFAPYPEGHVGGNNAERDVTNWIAGAQRQIVFALNQLTRGNIATQLVAAANRGVQIDGVMPRSDTGPGKSSTALYSFLTNTTSYATTNRIRFWPAFSSAGQTNRDEGEDDLVHAKYMVIDPFGPNPSVIHGSANWTAAALTYTNGNDENVIFLRHHDIAPMFVQHFKHVTGAFTNQNDFWISRASQGNPAFNLWVTETTRTYAIDSALSPTGTWSTWQTLAPDTIGWSAITNEPAQSQRFFRARSF